MHFTLTAKAYLVLYLETACGHETSNNLPPIKIIVLPDDKIKIQELHNENSSDSQTSIFWRAVAINKKT